MGQPAEKRRRATYAELEAVPPGKVAELVDGELHVMPRPAPRHANAAGVLVGKLSGPFQFGNDGPGGWWILPEPEIHFRDPTEVGAIHAVVPDIAGWRMERMPELPEAAYFALAPDWICEILSPSSEDFDRTTKMPLYADHGVRWSWLIDPLSHALEVYEIGEARRWRDPTIHRGDIHVRAAPFDAIEIHLSDLWSPRPGGGKTLGRKPT